MEISNLYTSSTSQFLYYDGNVDLNLITTLYFRPDYITGNNYYELLMDIETKLVVYNYDNNITTEYALYSGYDLKPFIDTFYTTIADIVDYETGEIIVSGADLLVPSPELTDIWGSYYDIEIGTTGGDSSSWGFTFYKENDDFLYSEYINIPSMYRTADFYQNKFLDARYANTYFARDWQQIYNQEFIEIGKSEGFSEGLEEGLEEGKELGREEGYNLGYDVGYDVGFEEGATNGTLTTFGSVIKVISDNASALLQTEILPNFTISNIIFIPVIFSLLGIIFKFFRR